MHAALADLRRARRVRRLGDVEWFDVAYRAYLAAFLGGGAVIVVSGAIGDREVDSTGIARVLAEGPAWIGVVAAAVLLAAVRGGTRGGPVSIERADVVHVLLAPVSRADALRRPVGQRLRVVAGGGAIVGAIAGHLAGQRLPGDGLGWVVAGAVTGTAIGALAGAAAVLAHVASRGGLRPLAARLVVLAAVALAALQLVAAVQASAGPFDAFAAPLVAVLEAGVDDAGADLAVDLDGLAPVTTSMPAALGAGVVTLLAVVGAVLLAGRLELEPLVRRAALVSQLRFAATVQDLRTVVLLRRQLTGETARSRPWWGRRRRVRSTQPAVATSTGRRVAASTLGRAVVARGFAGLARTPLGRVLRMCAVAALAGAAAVAFLRGTTPAALVLGMALFVLGLDALEPLSQEIDRPAMVDAAPTTAGRVHRWALVAPAVALVPVALVGAAAVTALEPAAAAGAFALAVPVAWLGAAGSVVSTVRDSGVPAGRADSMMPPEFAGVGSALRAGVPVAISTLAVLPVWAMRAAPSAATALRAAVGVALVLALLGWWVDRRQQWRLAIDRATEDAQAAMARRSKEASS